MSNSQSFDIILLGLRIKMSNVIFTLFFVMATATIDMNFPELEYLADHLKPEECRKLVAALHFQGYGIISSAVDFAERKVPEDVPCLQLLVHWNSGIGEGLGKTHEIVEHRLRQIGQNDLADWLGKTVFRQLGKELEKSMDNPFKDILTENLTKSATENEYVDKTYDDDNVVEWLPVDTIMSVLLVSLSVSVTVIVVGIGWTTCCRYRNQMRRKRLYRQKRKYQTYDEFDKEQISDSESESEYTLFTQKKSRAEDIPIGL